MKDNFLELLTEEDRKFYEEFMQCKNMEEICLFEKKWNAINESRKNHTLPNYDMTLEGMDKKYKLFSHEEVWKKMLE